MKYCKETLKKRHSSAKSQRHQGVNECNKCNNVKRKGAKEGKKNTAFATSLSYGRCYIIFSESCSIKACFNEREGETAAILREKKDRGRVWGSALSRD